MKPFFIGSMIVLLAVMPVHAGGYVGQLNNCYVQPVKGYGYGYNHYYKQQIVYVPGYQVGSALREEAIADRAAQKAREQALLEFNAKLEDFKADLSGKVSFEFNARGGASASSGASSSTGGAVGGGEGLAKFQQIMEANRCTTCHAPSGTMSSFDLTDVSKLSADQLRKTSLWVHLGKMPPKGKGDVVNQEDSDWLTRFAAELD